MASSEAMGRFAQAGARACGAVARMLLIIARGMAAFLAAYTGLSLFALVLGGSHDQNAWWIDLSMLPTLVGPALEFVLVVVLVAFVIRVPRGRFTRWFAAALCALFCLFAILNSAAVYEAQAFGLVRLGFPFPFSGFIALIFLWLALALLLGYRCMPDVRKKNSKGSGKGGNASGASTTGGRSKLSTAFGIITMLIAMGALFPLGQILCFGTTDYRQPVDAVVVFGAQVLPDGTPSLALKDRLDTAIDLYDQGLAPTLIMSGGIDVEGVSEAVAMKDYAVSRGVPEQAVQVDEYGNTTQATVRNTIEMAREQGFEQLGVTSSFYHMARIKMLYLVNGVDVFTMPAPLDEHDLSLSFTTLREIPGWWYYWFASIFA